MADADEPAHYRNLTSILGAALTTVSAVLFLVFFVLDLFGFHTNPYFGIVTFLLLPAAFVFGLALIPVGLWRERRRVAQGKPASRWPVVDLSRPSTRRALVIVAALTCLNIVIVATASYKSHEFMDSTAFCAGACHTPMEPEAVAHKRGVHASISCSSCHVGPGASGLVQAKLGGVRRLAAVITGSYERPIPVPVHDLPAAVGTCGSCHTATAYVGDVVRQLRYFSDDEHTSEQITSMTMRVGGGGWEAGGPHGVHWHASPQTRVEYIASDDQRETIPWVRVTDHKGEVREYSVEGFASEQAHAATPRVMDCTDCHNRQGHPMAATAERAVDDALAKGLLPRSLPFVRREALAALAQSGGDHDTAARQVAERLTAFYAQHPNAAGDGRIAQAVLATQRLYSGNVFPAMNVTWGSYSNQLGHTDAPGCFRCHDDLHKTRTGAVISQDCETCHRMQ